MKLKDILFEQLEREIDSSRRTLERVPEGKNNWKPHEKSMELGYLASLVAVMPSWVDMMINTDEFDVLVPSEYQPVSNPSRQDLMDILERSAQKGKEALRQTTDEHLETNWKLLANGHVGGDYRRRIFILDGVIAHLAHHRGQLTVYLRLLNEPVPGLYGPSADERIH